jgi:hypothetical protein
MTLKQKIFLITSALLVVILILVLPGTQNPPVRPSQPVSVASFVPPPSMFHLWKTRAIVHSFYGDETGLVAGQQVVDDLDYIQPQGTHQPVYLAGDSRNVYTDYGSIYIDGSGKAELWGTPGGGRFAFLHMYSQNVAAARVGSELGVDLINPPKCTKNCNFGASDANTAAIVAALLKTRVKANPVHFYKGGTLVGYSGWPSSYQFSAGSCGDIYSCAIDAHLCLVLDQTADNYFAKVAYQGPKPKPKPFPLKLWNQYRVRHHKHTIPAYHKKSLTTFARIWNGHHNTCKGVVSNQAWHKKDKYISERFQGCMVYYWPTHPHWKPKIKKEKFLQ